MSYILIVFLLFCSAFFSGTEIAYTALNKLKLKKEGEPATRLEKLVSYIYNHYDRALSTVLIGNNLVNIAATSTATVIAVNLALASGGKLDDDTASGIVTIIMTILILIFGEITPKMIAKRCSSAFTKIAAWPLLILMIVFSPLVLLTTGIVNLFSKLWSKEKGEEVTYTEEELENLLETVEDEGIIDETHINLLQSALEFEDMDAADILTARINVIGLDINDDLDKMLEIINESQFSRYPVYEKTMDHVVGILYVKQLMRDLAEGAEVNLREMLLNPVYVPKTMKLHDIMYEFRKSQTHMAIVMDEYGGTAGIVTMEDVLEELVGEIWDENDDIVSEWQKITDTRFECAGDMNLSEFFDELDLDEDELDCDCATVGGWATQEIGAMPVEFDAFDYEHITVIVKQVNEDNHRIERLLILLHEGMKKEEK